MAALSTSALALAAAALATAYTGYESYDESKKQAKLINQQAQLQAQEQERLTTRQVELEKRNIDQTIDRQRVAYLASGVTLEGSPLLKLEETRRLGAENIEEIQKSGGASSEATLSEGRLQAKSLKSSGRSSLISGITQSISLAGRAS